MITDKMKEFNLSLVEDVNEFALNNRCDIEQAFTEVYVPYLVDNGESFVANLEKVFYKKDSQNVKINGYGYDDFFNTLTLVVCDYDNSNEVSHIGKVEITKQLKKATKFLRLCKSDFFEDIEETSGGYQAYETIKDIIDDLESVKIILLTNREAANGIPDDIKFGKIPIQYDVWDLERVCQVIYENQDVNSTEIELKKKYDYELELIKVDSESETYDCYIGSIPGEWLAQIYKDEGQKLIEKNVRSFLQATGKINKGLKKTLEEEPDMFMAYNNGISTTAEDILIAEDKSTARIKNINMIKNWQIVNGGQTTASIYNAAKNGTDISKVNIQMKLNVIKDEEKKEEIIKKISKYANSQNKINISDFSANDPYHVQMERLSRRIYVPTERGKSTERWYYERARGQYMVDVNRQLTSALKRKFKEMNPKSKCISKTVAAKCLMAWLKYPYIVSKGLETNFVEFSKMVKEGEIPNPNENTYKSLIAKAILFNECDKIVASQKLPGFKAQINYYTIALLSEYYEDEVDDIEIWNTQTISDSLAKRIETLSKKVWEHFMNPKQQGVNITQWCKKEDCWDVLKERIRSNEI